MFVCMCAGNFMFALQVIRSSMVLIRLKMVLVKLTMAGLVTCFMASTLLNLHIGKEVRMERTKRITPFTTTDLLL